MVLVICDECGAIVTECNRTDSISLPCPNCGSMCEHQNEYVRRSKKDMLSEEEELGAFSKDTSSDSNLDI